MTEINLLAPQSQPHYCQYVGGPCIEEFLPAPPKPRVFFAYSSQPPQIAETIANAVQRLRENEPEWDWREWTEMNVSGQLIFCEICKQLRSSGVVVADTTTLNFNLLFEIGFATSLGLPVVLIRDKTYAIDQEQFRRLGLLDTLGYIDFQNSLELAEQLPEAIRNAKPLSDLSQRAYREAPVYVIKSASATEGSLALESTLNQSHLEHRSYDPNEHARLTLNDARRNVNGSIAVMANLLNENREGANVHNALVAFVAGYAVANQRIVALLHEGVDVVLPIDYRDIVMPYELASKIPAMLRPILNAVYGQLQSSRFESPEVTDIGILRELDLGDVAAENEVRGLQDYFVPTGQSIAARQGHAPLVVGRKGSGKSAIFYEILNVEARGVHDLTIDLRPEGNQFARLREFVEAQLSKGMQEFALTGFWTYLLLTELARKLLEHDASLARRDAGQLELYSKLEKVYASHDPGEFIDFPQRLVQYVNRLIESNIDNAPSAEAIMWSLYGDQSWAFRDSVNEYLEQKDTVWLLIDNLDKNWPVGGSSSTDILLLRSLLEATRKLRNELEHRDVEFNSLIFLRSDIYDHLVAEAPDKGKDTAIRLDWFDPVAFEHIVERRVLASTDLQGSFREQVWPSICAPLVGTEESFAFVLSRTLMRPRDLLIFLRRCVETAINRGHNRIEEDDIRFAETTYSNDVLANLQYEIVDLNPSYEDILLAFIDSSAELDMEDVRLRLGVYAGLESAEDSDKGIETLIRYGFLGVLSPSSSAVSYSFSVDGHFSRLKHALDNDGGRLVIHPAFRRALDVE